MRTEQYLDGYDCCRNALQGIIGKHPELQQNKDLMKLAQYPYYESDGLDWHPLCEGCKNWDWDDWNNAYLCFKGFNKPSKIKNNKCEFREEKEEKE